MEFPACGHHGFCQVIAENYVYRSVNPQYTLYGMKWDYKSSNSRWAYGWHQYATSAHWAQSIARIMDQLYARTGTGKSVNYIIPKYK